MSEPEEKPAPEVRGGDRPTDYIPDWAENGGFPPGTFTISEDDEDEPPGGNDPEAQ